MTVPGSAPTKTSTPGKVGNAGGKALSGPATGPRPVAHRVGRFPGLRARLEAFRGAVRRREDSLVRLRTAERVEAWRGGRNIELCREVGCRSVVADSHHSLAGRDTRRRRGRRGVRPRIDHRARHGRGAGRHRDGGAVECQRQRVGVRLNHRSGGEIRTVNDEYGTWRDTLTIARPNFPRNRRWD